MPMGSRLLAYLVRLPRQDSPRALCPRPPSSDTTHAQSAMAPRLSSCDSSLVHKNGAGSPVAVGRGGLRPQHTKQYYVIAVLPQTCSAPSMKQTMLLKLVPTPEQVAALLDTLHAVNAACTYAGEVAFKTRTANQFEVQQLVYGPLRVDFGLPAQLAIRAISTAVDADKRDRSSPPTFTLEGAIAYDERGMACKGPDHRLAADPARARARARARWPLSARTPGRHKGTSRSALAQRTLVSSGKDAGF